MSDNIFTLHDNGAPMALSVIIPVCGRHDDAVAVYRAYSAALQSPGRLVEFIYVLDAPLPGFADPLRELQSSGEPIVIVQLAQRFGEAISINVGVERAQADRLLILAPYLQVEPSALPALIDALQRVDVAAAVRDRRGDHRLNRIRAWSLAQVARVAGGSGFDLGCMAVACRRDVLREVALQDEHHRFLPLLAHNAGFAVERFVLPQASADRRFRSHRSSTYIGRAVDLMAIAFLLRFMQRPFRFFGSVGAVMAVAGIVLGLVLSFERLVLQVSLAERPALLLAVVLVVMGLQIAAVGLIAEIIIFTRSRGLTTYRVAQVVEQAVPATPASPQGVEGVGVNCGPVVASRSSTTLPIGRQTATGGAPIGR